MKLISIGRTEMFALFFCANRYFSLPASIVPKRTFTIGGRLVGILMSAGDFPRYLASSRRIIGVQVRPWQGPIPTRRYLLSSSNSVYPCSMASRTSFNVISSHRQTIVFSSFILIFVLADLFYFIYTQAIFECFPERRFVP